MKLDRLPPDLLHDFWPLIGDFIAGVARRSGGLWTVPGMVRRILSAEIQLWVATEDETVFAIAGTLVFKADNGEKWCEILFATGRERRRWQHLLAGIEDWARSEGCARMRSIARVGWARVYPEYRQTHALIEKGL
jgi:GNAT superfamily N-acetyltransferase